MTTVPSSLSDVLLQSIIDNTLDGLIVIDDQGRILEFNRASETIFGWSKKEILGRNISDLMTAPYQQAHAGYIDKYLKGAEPGLIGKPREFEAVRKDGAPLFVTISVTEFVQDGARFFTGLVKDNTAFRLQEQSLAASQRETQLLLKAVEASSVGMSLADATHDDFALTYVNQAFERVTGYTRAEVIGTNCRFLQGPDTDPATVTTIRQAIKDQKPVKVDLLNYRKTGEAFWNQLTLSPVFDQNGKLTSYIGIQTDITVMKQHAQQEQQRQKMEALGNMAGGVAHEINNALLPIILLAEEHISRAGTHKVHPDHAGQTSPDPKDLETILEYALHARSIVEDILAYARQSSREIVAVSAEEILSQSLRLSKDILPDHLLLKPAFTNELTDYMISVNRTGFLQVIVNIIKNAAQSMSQPGQIDVVVTIPAPNKLKILIKDQGHGIPSDKMSMILDPFFTTKAEGEGSGLGLSVVSGFVQDWGGTLEIQSKVDEGTEVVIQLPADRPVLESEAM